MSTGRKVCHLTTVHRREDSRIFHKECVSLAGDGFRVSLIVNDGLGHEARDGVQIHDIGGVESRLARVVLSLPKTIKAALRNRADIYHFHDPELMFVGFLLRLFGKRVIYDVHEDLVNDISNKNWIKPLFRIPLRSLIVVLEKLAARVFHGCVCTTPTIVERFQGYGATVALIRNYPILDSSLSQSALWKGRNEFRMCYAGGISANRGLEEMVKVAEITETPFDLMGPVGDPALFESLKDTTAWNWVNYKGVLNKQDVSEIYNKCTVGLAVLHPDINYVNSLPIKIFEYMQHRLVVVCSDFDAWKKIVHGNECGLCVNPLSVSNIAEAVLKLKEKNELTCRLADNGHRAVTNSYGWATEFSKLSALYRKILTDAVG